MRQHRGSSIQEVNLTSTLSRKCHHSYSKHELRSSDDREPNGNWNVLQRYGVDPVTTFSGIFPELVYRGKGSKPEGQCHLGKEGAHNEREEGIPEGLFATIRWKCEDIQGSRSIAKLTAGMERKLIPAVNKSSICSRFW